MDPPAAFKHHKDGAMKKLYLKPNIVAEPLVDRWYAWSHIISPATAAMNITERHLSIMESYLKSPQIHAAAVANPSMLGGPFIDYRGGRVDEIKDLLLKTKEERAHMIEMAAAIKQIDGVLRNEAKGYSLDAFYDKIPDNLRGYIELAYDLNNNPSFRIIEPLLYKSSYYNSNAQSLILSVMNKDDRPFVLSTPRLDNDGEVYLQIPFDHPGVNALFKMKNEPQTFSSIKEILEINEQNDKVFQSFLTEERPPEYKRYEGKNLRWRYFGHACILIETPSISILSDPVFSYTYQNDISRYTYDDLPESIDYVLITHNHQDHILFETMLQIRHKVKNVIVPRSGGGALQDPSLALLLRNIGFKNVIEMDEMDEIPFENGVITGIPFFGEHADLNIRTKLAYYVRMGKNSLLLAADSCNLEPKVYEHLHNYLGDIDVCFLGMECDGAPLTWLYGPLITKTIDRKMDQSRRLAGSNYTRGIDIVNRFHCKEVYVYAMGQEPWLNYIMSLKYTEDSNPIIQSNKLIEDCRHRGIPAKRLYGEKEVLWKYFV
jgi:L-ascorbate metabolism protein UlaG (beta-lactamase superfamily)